MSKTNAVNVYNGYTDLDLQFNGKWYRFPQGQVTRMEDQYCWAPDDYRREHESDPDPNAILERTYSARAFVEMLLTRHHQNLVADRVVWIGEGQPSEQDKKRCDEFGRVRKMKQVEEALADRRAALAKGGRPELDPCIVEWMLEYGIHDDLYNPVKQDQLTESMAKAFTVIAQQQAVARK